MYAKHREQQQASCQRKPTFTGFPKYFAFILHFVSMFNLLVSFSFSFFFSERIKQTRFESREHAECFREFF